MSTAESTPRRIPDLEDLAAYLDGRLEAAERQAVEERLAEDTDYYQTMVETVHFREEMAADGSVDAGPVTSSRTSPRRPILLWQGLAAAAVLVLAVGLWHFNRSSASELFYATVDAPAVLAIEGWDQRGWRVNRSTSLPAGLSRSELAFRLGTHQVGLKLALLASDRDLASTAVAHSRQVVEVLGSLKASSYGHLKTDIDSDEPMDELRTLADSIEQGLLKDFEPSTAEGSSLRAGQWCEMARLSALGKLRQPLLTFLERPPASVLGLSSEGMGSGGPTAQEIEAGVAVEVLMALKSSLEGERVEVAVFDQAEEALQDIQAFLGG